MDNFEKSLHRARALHKSGDISEASDLYSEFTRSHPEMSEPWHLLGVVKLQSGAFSDAITYFQEALSREPKHLNARNNLGATLYKLNRYLEAEEHLNIACQLEPTHSGVLYNLGNVYVALGKHIEANQTYKIALNEVTDKKQGYDISINAAIVFAEYGHFSIASEYISRANSLMPNDVSCLAHTAWVAERLNKVDEARKINQLAWQVDPQHPLVILNGARLNLHENEYELAITKADELCKNEPPIEIMSRAKYLKGEALDKLSESDLAFSTFNEANELELKRIKDMGIDPSKWVTQLDEAKERIRQNIHRQKQNQPKLQQSTPIAEAPVFFIGFPRSGATLLEQMLSSHPGVLCSNKISPLERVFSNLSTIGDFDPLDDKLRKQLQAKFLQETENIMGKTEGYVFIDKSPLNVRFVDLGCWLFPNAKVLMMLRDPRDVCLSCYMQHFAPTNVLANFLSLESTVASYCKVMDLWIKNRNEAQLNFLEVRYEDLIEDVEPTLRKILTFLALPWSSDTMKYQKNAYTGRIKNPSRRQVVEPLYLRSKGRWQSYEKNMDGVLPALQPYIKFFGYAE